MATGFWEHWEHLCQDSLASCTRPPCLTPEALPALVSLRLLPSPSQRSLPQRGEGHTLRGQRESTAHLTDTTEAALSHHPDHICELLSFHPQGPHLCEYHFPKLCW